jgi:chaperone required for assembly of F1-ATPase
MSETPIETAQRLTRPELPRRFYTGVSIDERAEGFVVMLDGRPARTPGRALLAVPTMALANLLVAEWRGQGEVIAPETMPATRLVNVALDAVRAAPGPVRAETVKFVRSDLVCYRAGEPAGLVARQAEAWDPVLNWARSRFGARFVLSEGVMFVEQPPESIAAIAAVVDGFEVLPLAALQSMTTLTGSALLALAVALGQWDVETAWVAAHVDEDWNILHWGEDEEAAARRAFRFTEMQAAARVALETAPG